MAIPKSTFDFIIIENNMSYFQSDLDFQLSPNCYLLMKLRLGDNPIKLKILLNFTEKNDFSVIRLPVP